MTHPDRSDGINYQSDEVNWKDKGSLFNVYYIQYTFNLKLNKRLQMKSSRCTNSHNPVVVICLCSSGSSDRSIRLAQYIQHIIRIRFRIKFNLRMSK